MLRSPAVFATMAITLGGLTACGPGSERVTAPRAYRHTTVSVLPPTGSAATTRVCGNKGLLAGPRHAPAHAVIVRAGDDSKIVSENWLIRPNATYWFAPGTHTLGPGIFAQIQPKSGDTFIGAPGAVIDGQNVQQAAFTQQASNVKIEYLTIQDFAPVGQESVVNHDAGAHWTLEHNTIQENGDVRGSNDGGALGMGSGDVYKYNCITHNGQYGLNAGGSNTTFSDNEVSWNGISFFPDTDCGCSGGLKYWDSTNTKVTDNYIHDNYNVGLWYDTDNAGALIEGNVIARNWSNGLIFEISYNAFIHANTFLDNGWGEGSTSGPAGYPLGSAIYISGSGGSSAVDNGRYSTLTVSANVLVDNWDGIIVYQNPNRLCGSSANSSSGFCTLVNPALFSPTTCPSNDGPGSSPGNAPDFWDGCQWKTQNVLIEENIFSFNPADIIYGVDTLPDITNSDCYEGTNFLDTSQAPPSGNGSWCGFNGMFSLFGSASGGPADGWATADAIMGLTTSSGQKPDDNIWTENTYYGPWAFQAYVQGGRRESTDRYPHGVATTLKFAGWQSVWGQDVGSSTSDPTDGGGGASLRH